jgi:hypothetical protein
MTKEELIEIAEQVYGKCDWHGEALNHLEQLAKLVAEKERGKYTKLYEEEIRSIKEAATQYGIPNEDAAGMLLFCEEFARMVAEKEREACAKLAEEYANGLERNYSEIIADSIRARGQ